MLQNERFMDFVCRHCEEAATGSMYRVLSEEGGIVLLDMVVCRSCYDHARQLGLDGEEIKLDQNFRAQLPAVRSITETARQY
jgi:hypothetical protein